MVAIDVPRGVVAADNGGTVGAGVEAARDVADGAADGLDLGGALAANGVDGYTAVGAPATVVAEVAGIGTEGGAAEGSAAAATFVAEGGVAAAVIDCGVA